MEQKVFDTSRLRSTYFAQALPVVLGSVVSLIYNLADTYFIAQTGDALLVAGVSLCSPVFILLMAFGHIYAQGARSSPACGGKTTAPACGGSAPSAFMPPF